MTERVLGESGSKRRKTATQSYSWKVEFTPDAATLAKGVQPANHCESTGLTITN